MSKPDAVKEKAGTLQKCRVKNNPTYEPLTEIPAPSFDLNDFGMDYFAQFCNILLSNKTLTMADIPGITRNARMFELYKEADDGVRKDGAVQVTKTGYTAKTGYFVTMTDAMDRIEKFEALYGMNLASRLKMNLPKPAKKNAFEEI